MMLRGWRLWPLLFVLILLSHQAVFASDLSNEDSAGIAVKETNQDSTSYAPADDSDQAILHDVSAPEVANIPGASTFQEALSKLQKLHRTPRRSTRFSKPTGIFGSFIYYARELFFLLFMNGPSKVDSFGTQSSSRKLTGRLLDAVQSLDEAREQGNVDAIYTLAEFNFYGYYSHPRNYTKAFELYSTLAALNGNATAQHMLGLMHATGIGGATEKDQARALLYHTFAADAGDVQSQMTVAFRHHAGIGTGRDCEEAVHYYKLVADKAMNYVRSGPPGGRLGTREVYRLADEEGGLYGDGASFSSSGINARAGTNAEANSDFDNVLEYMDYMARKGELRATFHLGRLHYDGSRGFKPDFKSAKNYFYDVARRYWTKEGKIRPDTEQDVDKWATKAAGYLGRMFMRGEGMPQNFEKARIWFERGIKNGDALSQYSMGLMHLHGYDGKPKNILKASQYFAAAADQDLPSAQVQYGLLLLDQGDLGLAIQYFELAARHDHIEAFYYLAEIRNFGSRDRNCNNAALYYKLVAERAEALHSRFEEANEAYEDRDFDTALPLYIMAAEQGYEAGQVNVAFIVDQSRSSSTLKRLFPMFQRKASTMLGDAALALTYWTRSAKQMNIDSLVKMGDYYLYGIGTENSLPDAAKAMACYQAAAETYSAQAMWNLGWMHENGIGMEQDFHLAKRLYDQSAETNKEAYAPVTVALCKLRIRSWWNWISGGGVKGIKDDELPKKRYTLTEWLVNFIAADLEAYEQELARTAEEDEWDSSGMPGGDGIYGGPDELWFDDELFEALIILGLAATLALLVYWRQQRIMRQRAQAQAQAQGGMVPPQGAVQAQPPVPAPVPAPAPEQPGQQDRGMFPVPGDPEFMNWAVGGIGH